MSHIIIAMLVVAASTLSQIEVEAQDLKGSEVNADRREMAAAAETNGGKAREIRNALAESGVSISAASTPQSDDDDTVTTTKAQYIPHLAQGHGWVTYLDVINTCSEPVGYDIRFYGSDGQPMQFEFGGLGRFSRIYEGDSPLGKSIDSFELTNTGTELLQGAARVVEDGGGCIAVDIFYVQSLKNADGSEYVVYATVPLARLATAGSVLTFLNQSGCETHAAFAGTGDSVQIEAVRNNGEILGSADLGSVYHTAFPLSQKIPAVNREWGMLRISGEAAVVGIDFCSGELVQFRLPHLAPIPGRDSPEMPSDPP